MPLDRVQLGGRRRLARRTRRHREGDLDHGAVVGIGRADHRRDRRAPVTALRHVAVVAESRHQRGERRTDPLDAPARRRRPTGEPEARQATARRHGTRRPRRHRTPWGSSAARSPCGTRRSTRAIRGRGCSGSASSCGERMWTKWTSRPSISVRYWSKRLSSGLAGPPVVRRRPSTPRPPARTRAGSPATSRRPPPRPAQRVLCSRLRRSARSASGMAMVNGRTEASLMART